VPSITAPWIKCLCGINNGYGKCQNDRMLPSTPSMSSNIARQRMTSYGTSAPSGKCCLFPSMFLQVLFPISFYGLDCTSPIEGRNPYALK
jgi:hypothetical protein